MRQRYCIFLFVLTGMVVLLPFSSQALTQHGKHFLNLSAGGFFPLHDDDHPLIQVSNGIWTETELGMTVTTSLEASVQLGWGRTGISFQGNRIGHIEMMPISALLRYRLFPRDNIVPFLWGGFGYSFNRADGESIEISSKDHWIWKIGAGVDFFLTPSWVLRFDARYQGNQTQITSSGFKHTTDIGAFIPTVGVVWYW